MRTTAAGPPTADVTLPAEWRLTTEALASLRVVRAFGGRDRWFCNSMRAHLQLGFAAGTYP